MPAAFYGCSERGSKLEAGRGIKWCKTGGGNQRRLLGKGAGVPSAKEQGPAGNAPEPDVFDAFVRIVHDHEGFGRLVGSGVDGGCAGHRGHAPLGNGQSSGGGGGALGPPPPPRQPPPLEPNPLPGLGGYWVPSRIQRHPLCRIRPPSDLTEKPGSSVAWGPGQGYHGPHPADVCILS